jgi:hypothetical protein
MSGQFETESGGTVGIYRKKGRYELWATDGKGVGNKCLLQLTEDELYRLIYMASKDLRQLVSYSSWLKDHAGEYFYSSEIGDDMKGLVRDIPTEAEITKRRRAAQRRNQRR